MLNHDQPGELALQAEVPLIHISGDWTLAHLPRLDLQIAALNGLPEGTRWDFQSLGKLDTAGAALLIRLIGAERLGELEAIIAQLSTERQALLRTVAEALNRCQPSNPPSGNAVLDVLEHIGKATLTIWDNLLGLLGFIGLTLEALAKTLFRPRRWRLTALISQMEQSGLDAVPIVTLLTFMVGAVVAFLGATVLNQFGATIYTVDLVGFSFLREFGVLLTAILLAGRTASAFTAQIGSMKANQEIDAIQALGLNPMELLVLPRVLALLLTLPMLTFLAMLAGLLGGAVVCALSLDISPRMFLYTLQRDLAIQHFLVGMIKAPVFAFVIAVIGCLEGFRVSGSAQSVGSHTTSSVVQSIFVVILLDALFALFFMEMGW